MKISPRFGIMMTAMILSVLFEVLDILSVVNVFKSALPSGQNPFYRMSLIFKLLTDTIILDDFKTALDKIYSIRESRSLGRTKQSTWPVNRRTTIEQSSASQKDTEASRSFDEENASGVLADPIVSTTIEPVPSIEMDHRSQRFGGESQQ